MGVLTRSVWLLTVCLAVTAGCKDRESDPPTPAATRTSGSLLAAEICGVVADILGVQAEELSPDVTLGDLSADELDLVEIIMELEDRYEISISDEAIEREAGGAELAGLPKNLKIASLIKLVTEAREAKPKGTRPSV